MDSRLRTLRFIPVACLFLGILALAPVRGALAQPACVPSPHGLVAWWPLDEAEGATKAIDMVGGRDASYVGAPVPAQGKVGSGLRLNGSDECLQLPDEDVWDLRTGDFTFEFWLNLDEATGGYEGQPGDVLIGHSEGPYNVDKYIFALAPGQAEFITCDEASQVGTLAPKASWSPEPGTWHHVALTRHGADYGFWFDGDLAVTEQNLAVLPPADATLTFGCVQEFWDGWLNGVLDEIAVYKRALKADEIAALAEAGAEGRCAPVQLCGDVDDGGAITASDALSVLKAAVGGAQCDWKACLCDVDGNAKVSASDALAALRIAVGQDVEPKCGC